MFGWDDAILYGVILGSDFVYHRWLNPPPSPTPPTYQVTVPITDVGSPYASIYGRARVRKAVLAWNSVPLAYQYDGSDDPGDPHPVGDGVEPSSIADGTYTFAMSMHFAIGFGFAPRNWPAAPVNNHIHTFFVGDQPMSTYVAGGLNLEALSNLNGDGDYENPLVSISSEGTIDATGHTMISHGVYIAGELEFLNGNPGQALVDPVTFASATYAGNQMSVGGFPARIPGYRGMLSAFLHSFSSRAALHIGPDENDAAWVIGTNAQIDAYSFEVSSYPPVPLGPSAVIGQFEANAVDVLYDLLTNTRGKLGLSTALIDSVSFAAAAMTLASEANGYSRSIEDGQTAEDAVNEILEQIDGILYFDPASGLIKLKLVRADYDPNAVPEIGVDNCQALQGVAIGGWTGLPNRVRISYTNRDNAYIADIVTAQNQANAVGQDGAVNEIQLNFPGVCTLELAQAIAARELAARSRPIAKLTAVVNRSFYATNPGDVVAVTWPEYGWSRIYFRVATIDRGTLANGAIQLGLIQEYFQVYRGATVPGRLPSFPTTSHV